MTATGRKVMMTAVMATTAGTLKNDFDCDDAGDDENNDGHDDGKDDDDDDGKGR